MRVYYCLPALPIAQRHGQRWLGLAGAAIRTHNRKTRTIQEGRKKPIGRSVFGTS